MKFLNLLFLASIESKRSRLDSDENYYKFMETFVKDVDPSLGCSVG